MMVAAMKFAANQTLSESIHKHSEHTLLTMHGNLTIQERQRARIDGRTQDEKY